VASLTESLDIIRFFEKLLQEEPPDDRHRFLTAAQKIAESEISWFFRGRDEECTRITQWLKKQHEGMLVTDPPSREIHPTGQLLVRSLPDLRNVLIRRKLIPSLSERQTLPEAAFDQVIHLSGLTIPDTIDRISKGAGIGVPPSHEDPSLGLASDLDWLVDQLRERSAPFTLLVDALDESTDPLDLACGVLAPIAAQPHVRVVVGTRASTEEAVDHPSGE
jgi:hypothetical protein